MLPKPALATGLTGTALSFSGSAWAHGTLGDTSIWTASAHLFTSPLSLAALIGLALVLFGIREPWSVLAAGLAALAATLATLFSPNIPALAAPAAVVILGLGAVSGGKPSTALALVLSVLAGLAAGLAAGSVGKHAVHLASQKKTRNCRAFLRPASRGGLTNF